MLPSSLMVIDGARAEGGGGTLRTALSMSALTQQPIRIDQVRGGTSHPGLDHEDIVFVRALATATNAETVGLDAGSSTLTFQPTRRPSGLKGTLDVEMEPGRRSPNTLVVLSALAPVLARSGMYSQVALSGETYGHRALSFDYFANVVTTAFAKLGMGVFPDMDKAGFGRESPGQMRMEVEPSSLNGVDWSERGSLISCRAVIATGGLPSSVARRGLAHLARLGETAGIPVEIELSEVETASPGAFVTVWSEYERGFGGGTAMGSRGLRIETLAQTAFEELLGWIKSGATVDPYLADQLLIPMAMADTPSAFKVSELTVRFLSSVAIVKQFLPIHITVRGSAGQPGSVTIKR